MSNLPKVWVIQEGRNDYSSAEEFGEVRFITESDLMMIEGRRNKEVRQDYKNFVAQYVAGIDYILPAGNPMLVATFMLSLPRVTHKLLKWDGRRAIYFPFEINPIN